MKMKVLKMVVLVMALLAVGYMKANTANTPWSQTALAEESLAVGNVGDLKIGDASMWEKSCADLVEALDAEEIAVRKMETEEGVIRQVVAENIAVSDYVADEMVFMYHGDEMCMYSYEFEKECSRAQFDYVVDALNAKYGTAVRKSFSFKGMSDCAMFEAMDELNAVITGAKDEELDWTAKAVKTVAGLFTATPREVYEWKVDGHTKISLCYAEKNSFLAKDNFYIIYSNQQPHGETLTFQEVEKEYNVNGL